ncbi:MAG: anhydro-N-acetylmuramic acid kinase [Rubrivivax sp.]|nr:anhydro-N-acetylmuramic acid kinase [Rubrivivax sp.]
MPSYIGLMSGTSLDGVDAVLAEWPEPVPARSSDAPPRPRERGFVHVAMPAALRAELLALNRSDSDELHRGALAANALARLYARAVDDLLVVAGTRRGEVRALGAHGQTVRHRPGEFDGHGYTLQLLNGALLAELSDIDVVCDLRSRDVAAGGQGAPLVPAFHAEAFGDPARDVAVLNVGGIANLTLMPRQGRLLGFDCGPGNLLMDHWMQRQPVPGAYDADGRLAARGEVLPELLRRCIADPFFDRPPPKSTGRDLFDGGWLDQRLAGLGDDARAEDVMATLAELTATAAIEALRQHAPSTRQLFVCGGGAFNAHLMRRLEALAGAGVAVGTTAAAGIAPDRVEALAFAWLAHAHCERRPGNLSAVTGAAGPRVLGALYPAS